ncbi:unnamed protein product [Clavelina lepadiformis]|uniref:Uncharacterized protein n=1 Tax=Clavelina lepadiformis TaxID=159417 RepID=A0ABP0EV24_CLALP
MSNTCANQKVSNNNLLKVFNCFSSKTPNQVVLENRNILVERLTKQLKWFYKKGRDDIWWCKGDNQRRYISLLTDVHELFDEQLTEKAAELFPQILNLNRTKLNSSFTAILCELLIKQNKLKELNLWDCFSNTDDVGRIISAIINLPRKIQVLNINGNIIPEIPSREFFAKVEEKLDMWDCFSRGDGIELGRAAIKSERNQIQKILNELEDTKLKVWIDGFSSIRPQK